MRQTARGFDPSKPLTDIELEFFPNTEMLSKAWDERAKLRQEIEDSYSKFRAARG